MQTSFGGSRIVDWLVGGAVAEDLLIRCLVVAATPARSTGCLGTVVICIGAVLIKKPQRYDQQLTKTGETLF